MAGQRAVVVGGGLAGLSCARQLQRHGRDVTVVEAADDVGGRVRTDPVEGFLCDRGFQVYTTSYPEGRRQLDHAKLDLGRFSSGSLIFDGERLRRFADPLREPRHAVASLRSGVGTLADKLRLLKLSRDARSLALRPRDVGDHSAAEELGRRGFSEGVRRLFLRPFLGGIFLEPELRTSARMLMFVFGMFATGEASLPAGGMRAIPRQLAEGLTVRCGTPAENVDAGGVTLAGGERWEADAVVLAADQRTAAGLLPGLPTPGDWRSTTTLYFASPTPAVGEPTLVLNGTGEGLVNTVAELSSAQPAYAPAGQTLLSVSLRSPATEDVTDRVLRELSGWFENVGEWRFLHRTDVPWALPDQSAGTGRPPGNAVVEGVHVCGDWRSFGSIHHAMASGRRAAAAVLTGSLDA